MKDRHCTEVLVLDAAALLSPYHLLSTGGCLVTTSLVVEEVKDSENYERLLLSLSIGRVLVLESPKGIEVRLPGRILRRLSEADLSVLRLALWALQEGLKPRLVSDDYALQEAARALGIPFQPIKTRGIRT